MRANDLTSENSILFHFISNFRANCYYRGNWSRRNKTIHVFIVDMIAPTNAIQKRHVKPVQNNFYQRFFQFFLAEDSHLLRNERIRGSHGLKRREDFKRLTHALYDQMKPLIKIELALSFFDITFRRPLD